MTRINLLPWRETLRAGRRKRFLGALGIALAVTVGAVWLAGHWIGKAIERQMARNNYLRAEHTLLDQRLAEIEALKRHREELLARMSVIQGLQGQRSGNARVFEQLARTLPDGVYFTEMSLSDRTLSISGAAESNQRISELMRNLDASSGFDAPGLHQVKAVPADAAQPGQRFQLTVGQTQALDSEVLQ